MFFILTLFAGKPVVTEKVGNISLIGINRPQKRNCVNVETAELLLKVFEDFEKDDDSYVAVLYGKGAFHWMVTT